MDQVPEDIAIRAASDGDADGLVELVGGCFAEYDGCVLDLPGVDRALLSIQSSFFDIGGEFWVAESGGKIVGSAGYTPHSEIHFELKRLYVEKKWRRRGLATRLLRLVEDAVARKEGTSIDLWSDTRFEAAHAFYVRHGYVKQPETRDLNDPSNTTEYHFIRDLDVGRD